MILPEIGRTKSSRMQAAIEQLGLKNGLQICLDAADWRTLSDSSQQTLFDTSAGTANDFFRGADGSATGTDPTINGNVGELGCYLSFDGGDYCRKTSANSTFLNSLHKDNATFTLLFWSYHATTSATTVGMFGTSGSTQSNVGIDLCPHDTTGGNFLRFACRRGGGNSLLVSSALTLPATTWSLWGVSLNEATATGLFYLNGATDAFSATYSSPSSSNATNVADLGATGNATGPLLTGTRLAAFMAWDRALSAAEMNALFKRTRTRFGV